MSEFSEFYFNSPAGSIHGLWKCRQYKEIKELALSLPKMFWDYRNEEVSKLQAENQKLKECLEKIAGTDISGSAPDLIWLTNWRNETKQIARQTLKEVEEK